VLFASGVIQCWGLNNYGQIGNGSVGGSAVTAPVSVTGISTAIAVTAGAYHTCALLADNSIRCWGANGDLQGGRIGSASGTPAVVPSPPGPRAAPITTAVRIAAGVGAGQLSSTGLGGYHTCALLSDGSGVCWGYFYRGVMGDGTMFDGLETVVIFPPNVGPVRPVTGPARSIAAGGYHTCVIEDGGLIQCWGYGNDGQIGNNAGSSVGVPTTATLPAGRMAAAVAAGGFHTCAVLTDASQPPANEVWCWGNNRDGQLGDTTQDERRIPTRVLGLP
jgi:alpha-tubulin suppressor-like RCC1 family protein